MKEIKTEDAIGCVLCHDITQIIKDVTKQVRFHKGHIVAEEDVPVLLSLGKEHLYVWDKEEGMLHENEAAYILRDMCLGEHMYATDPKEGKIEIKSETSGLFTIDIERMRKINALGEMMIATRASGSLVSEGDSLCGTRVIPLVIEEAKMNTAKELSGEEPLLRISPFKKKTFAVVTTGSEVYKGIIKDTFTPVVVDKLGEYGCKMMSHKILPDNHEEVTKAILEFLEEGADMVFCTGGMSVDPDDKTPLAIRNTGAEIVSYGAPVLPGAMFLISYTGDGRPICGLPGCVMYSKRTIFDLVLPYLLADIPVTGEWISGLGNGGLCLNCDVCHYPACSFGKGV